MNVSFNFQNSTIDNFAATLQAESKNLRETIKQTAKKANGFIKEEVKPKAEQIRRVGTIFATIMGMFINPLLTLLGVGAGGLFPERVRSFGNSIKNAWNKLPGVAKAIVIFLAATLLLPLILMVFPACAGAAAGAKAGSPKEEVAK